MNFDCLPANYKTHRHTRSLTHSQTHTSLQTITISGIWVFMKEKRISHKEWARERQKAVIEARIFISLFNNNKKTQNIHFEHMGIFIGRVCNRAQMLTPFFTNSFARLHIHNLFISILLFFSFLFFSFSFSLSSLLTFALCFSIGWFHPFKVHTNFFQFAPFSMNGFVFSCDDLNIFQIHSTLIKEFGCGCVCVCSWII